MFPEAILLTLPAMNASVLFNNLVSAVLLPPLNLAFLAVIGLCIARRRRGLGHTIVLLALSLLLVLSTGAGSRLLVTPLERMHAPLAAPRQAAEAAGAIVVLSGGRLENLGEYGGEAIPATIALLRVHYAAHLHRQTGLPILVTGGTPHGSEVSEAAVMARVLREHYRVPVRWLEEKSNNTAQNAQYSAALLAAQGVTRILLVTDAIHMPRSVAIFRKTGLDVVPAPTAAMSASPLLARDYIPDGAGLQQSHYAMHEWIGMLWYRLRY